MSQLNGIKNTIADSVVDIFEKASSEGSRAGAVVERVGKMHENGVDDDVIALQMSKNSPNNHRYTAQFVRGLVNLSEDSRTRVVITKKQSRALIQDQKTTGMDGEPCFSR